MRRCIAFLMGITVTMVLNCSHSIPYTHSTLEQPRQVWIEDQLSDLQTIEDFQSMPELYVQISQVDGKKIAGRLMDINSEKVAVSTGYTYKSQTNNLKRIEKIVSIPKKDILIMQVW